MLYISIKSWEFLPGGLDCRDPQESGWEILDFHWLPELAHPVYRAARDLLTKESYPIFSQSGSGGKEFTLFTV